ncbi:hypothetical protein V8F20_012442 [Naviculisporaceae sp. PSN 640]
MSSRIQFIDEGESLAASNNTNASSTNQDRNKGKQLETGPMPARTKPKRERAAHSKTRTGCRTCKARRVKCDERRPACLRCTTTGRNCGYEPPNPTRWLVVTGPSRPSIAHPLIHSILPTAYPGSVLEDEQVRDSFDFFRNVAAHELSHFFGRSFWLESLLSTSHQFPAVTSAILALSSLHRRLKDGQSAKGNLFAGRQYEKSLKQLIRAISSTTDKSHARIMSLLCGVVYTVIEVLNDSWSQARQHLDSIILLLNEEKTSECLNSGSETVLVSDTVLRDLRAVILRFDIEAATYSNGRSPRMALPSLPDPAPTTNLDKIEEGLYDLMLHAITFIHSVRDYRYQILDEPVPEQSLQNQQLIREKLATWWENHEHALKDLARGSRGRYEARRSASLIVQYHNCWTSLNCCVYPYETDFDAYYPNFVELVQYATLIHNAGIELQEGTGTSQTKDPAFNPVVDPTIDPALASFVYQPSHTDADNSAHNPVLNLDNLINPQSTSSTRRRLSPGAQSSTSSSGFSPHHPKRQISPPPYPKPTAFSPETGLLFPLFWAATRCRDGLLRRQALKQITLCQQEGVWCPGAQTRVASRVIELEEGLEPWSVLEACVNGDFTGAGAAISAAPDPYQYTQGTTLFTTPTPQPPVLPKASDIPEHRRCHHIMWPVDRVNRAGNMAYGILPRGLEGGWEIRFEWII